MKGFRVFALEPTGGRGPTHSRQDFYKICLLTGQSMVHYEDRRVALRGTCLFFGNPTVPYTSRVLSARQTGYACLFGEEFLAASAGAEPLQQSPLFRRGGTPVLPLGPEQAVYFTSLFQKLLAEQDTAYRHKRELLSSYLRLLLHEALHLRVPAGLVAFPYYFRMPGPTGLLGTGWRLRKARGH